MPDSTEHPPSGRPLAVLFADVAGYGALVHQDEADTVRRVRQSVGLLRNLIGDYRGSVQQVVGDGILATFESANQAVWFALVVQKEFRNDRVWNAGKPPIVFRIGISHGEVIVGADCLHGHCVNLAARVQGLAEPGGICITHAVRGSMRELPGAQIRSLGRPHMKNISDPPEVFAVTLSEDKAAVSSPRDLDRAPVGEVHTHDQPADPTVVVLPLANISGDPADRHLCTGTSTDIISNLTRFRHLLVTARHSAFVFNMESTSIAEIADRLGARYVMTGGLRRAGNKIRISVDLIEADTGTTLWSERYDGALEDIFDFQDDVAATTAARLAIHIDKAEKRRTYGERRPDLRAYGLLLRGQDMTYRFVPENNAHARRLFQQAREMDPQYGRCYAAISRTYNVEWRYNWTESPDQALDQALDLAKSAVQRDSLDARGYGEMGIAYLYKKRHEEAIAAYERALQLNPNDADLLAEMGDCLVYSRQARRSIALLKRAIRLNPYHPDAYLWYLGDAHFHLGEYEETIDTLRRMNDQSEGHRLMAASYALLGQLDEARFHAREVLKAHPNFSIEHWRTVPPNKYPEDLEVFINGLRQAGLH